MENKKEINYLYRIEYLQLIQEQINRVTNKSMIIKGFSCSTLICLIFIFFISDLMECLYMLPSIIVIVYMLIDTHYLLLRGKYQLLFNKVANGDVVEPYDYSLDITKFSKEELKENKATFGKCLLSCNNILFYGVLLAVTLLMLYFFIMDALIVNYSITL